MSARSLVESGGSTVFLDANRMPVRAVCRGVRSGPLSMQQPPELLAVVCDWLDLSSRNVSIMRGADEAIDSLMRAFCVPAVDNIIVCPPTPPCIGNRQSCRAWKCAKRRLQRASA